MDFDEKMIKQVELNIMIYIDKICRENDIKYFLAYGTLIGAIRHKGFIPWDDDIDILMERKDYEKFIKVFKENESYKLLNIYKDTDYYYPFVKVVDKNTIVEENDFKSIKNLGLWVDVFPLDYYDPKIIKENKVEMLKKKLLLSRSKIFLKTQNSFKNFVKYLGYCLYKTKSPRKYALQLDNIGKASQQKTNYYCVLFPPRLKKNIFPIEWFKEVIEIEFEGKKFFVPEKYDDILKTYYGNYMEIPSVENRKSGHNITVEYKK